MSLKQRHTVGERLEAGELTEAEAHELTREAALSSLDRAMQCRHGLETKLLQRGFPAGVVGEVLDRLVFIGLIDDLAYSEALTRARLDRGNAKRAIGAELTRKGVDPATVAEALNQIDSAQQVLAAERTAEQVVRRCQGLAPEVKARRAYAAVSRRGFSDGVAAAAVTKALATN